VDPATKSVALASHVAKGVESNKTPSRNEATVANAWMPIMCEQKN